YKKRSDSVLSFLEEEGYEKSNSENDYIQAQQLFAFYKDYCSSNNNFSLNKNNFLDRLRNAGFETDKKRTGVVVFIKKAF
ncbi:MAG: primase-like DNA-binding domain-containing protein, partial [Bacteroidia bacterium]